MVVRTHYQSLLWVEMEVQFPGESETKLIKKEDIVTMLTWDGEDWYIAGTGGVVEKTSKAAKILRCYSGSEGFAH